jgi:hypothetical protein
MEERNSTDVRAPGKLPAPWRGEVYKVGMGSSAELKVEEEGGSKVLFVANVANLHGQFFTAKPVVTPKPRHNYALKVEYKTLGTGFGEVGVRNVLSGLAPTQRVNLINTDGQWKTEEIAIDPDKSDKPIYLFVQPLAVGAANGLYLKSLEVIERPR